MQGQLIGLDRGEGRDSLTVNVDRPGHAAAGHLDLGDGSSWCRHRIDLESGDRLRAGQVDGERGIGIRRVRQPGGPRIGVGDVISPEGRKVLPSRRRNRGRLPVTVE